VLRRFDLRVRTFGFWRAKMGSAGFLSRAQTFFVVSANLFSHEVKPFLS